MIVVDTHVLIWDALMPARLSEAAQQAVALANIGDGLIVADISLWEIAMLIQKGRIQVGVDCQTFLNLLLHANRIVVRPISPVIAALSSQMDRAVAADPADRLILATALWEDVPLVTADRNLRNAGLLHTIW